MTITHDSVETTLTQKTKSIPWFSTFSRIHFIAGIFVAPLIFVAAFSGFFYALAPTIEKQLYHEETTATSGQIARPLGEQIDAARTVYPNLPVKGVQVPPDFQIGTIGNTTTRVLFSDPSFESKSWSHAVFVDPGSLEVKGDLVQYGSSSALPFRAWLSDGHRRLWAGDAGRVYSETAASWLGPLAVTGVLLWFVTRTPKQQGAAKRSAAKKGSRRVSANRHSLIGLIAVPGLIFLCVTGLTWSHYAGDNIAELRTELNWLPPKSQTALPPAAANAAQAASATTTDLDAQAQTVLSAAREAGLTGILQVNPPATTDQAWVATEIRQPFKLQNDSVSINGVTGEVVANQPFSSWPFAAQATAWLIQLHMGTLFGIYSQLALAVLALMILILVSYGYIMWFKRGRGSRAGKLPRPIEWSRLPRWALVTFGICLIGYAVLAPLFGVTLVAFMLVDALVRAVQRRRSGEVA